MQVSRRGFLEGLVATAAGTVNAGTAVLSIDAAYHFLRRPYQKVGDGAQYSVDLQVHLTPDRLPSNLREELTKFRVTGFAYKAGKPFVNYPYILSALGGREIDYGLFELESDHGIGYVIQTEEIDTDIGDMLGIGNPYIGNFYLEERNRHHRATPHHPIGYINLLDEQRGLTSLKCLLSPYYQTYMVTPTPSTGRLVGRGTVFFREGDRTIEVPAYSAERLNVVKPGSFHEKVLVESLSDANNPLIERFDLVEGFSGIHPYDPVLGRFFNRFSDLPNKWANELAQKHDKPVISTSDTHVSWSSVHTSGFFADAKPDGRLDREHLFGEMLSGRTRQYAQYGTLEDVGRVRFKLMPSPNA